ncbi:MAG TPA: PfkB family carbohydrate kinase, partial [Opitutales bacterium]|nr:PfkB family carbohydrate kinase [Opitutales bacterium]
NQAISAHKAGAPTLFVCAIGNDSFGQYAQNFYKTQQAHAQWIMAPDTSTGNAAIMVNNVGQNEVVISHGANHELRCEDVPLEDLRFSKILVCQLETKLEAVASILKIAKQHGITTLLNPAPAPKEAFPSDVYPHIDIWTPNENEFCALLKLHNHTAPHPKELHNLSDQSLRELCLKANMPRCIVTLGEYGCFVADESKAYKIKPHTGIHVVDTTGAGDAFTGALAAHLSRGHDLFESAAFANAAAALSTTLAGAATSMHTRTQIENFLKKHPSELY